MADIRMVDAPSTSVATRLYIERDIGLGAEGPFGQTLAAHAAQIQPLLDLLSAVPIAKSMTTTAPPGTPADSDMYLLPTSGLSGVWVGHEGKTAVWSASGSAWAYSDPIGAAIVKDAAKLVFYDTAIPGWVDTVGASSLATIPTLGSVASADGLAYTATGPAGFAMVAGTLFLFEPNTPNTGNVTLTVTPSGGGALGPYALLNRAGAQIAAPQLESKPYLCRVRNGTQFQVVVGLETDPIVTTMSISRSGQIPVQLASDASGQLLISESTDGTTANRRSVAIIDRTAGNLRLHVGKYMMGSSAGTAEEVYNRLNKQPIVTDDTHYNEIKYLIARSAMFADVASITPVTLTSTKPYYVSALNMAAPISAQAAGCFLDCRFMALGSYVDVDTGAGGTVTCKVFIGENAAFINSTAGNITATYANNAVFRIKRIASGVFALMTFLGSAPSFSTANRPIANKTILCGGQSFMAQMVNGGGLFGLQQALADQAITDDIYFADGSLGNTSMLNPTPASIDNYHWWNQAASSGPNTPDTPGPLATALATLITTITSAPISQPAPSALLWDQGQNDGVNMVTDAAVTNYATFKDAATKFFTWVQDPSRLNGVPIIIAPTSAADQGVVSASYTSIRIALAKVIGDNAGTLNLKQGPDTYDLARGYYNLHATFGGFSQNFYRWGLHIGNVLYAKTNRLGPTLEGEDATGGASGTYVIDINPNTTVADPSGFLYNMDAQPVEIEGFAITSNAEPYVATVYAIDKCVRSIVGSNTRLTFTSAAAAAGAGTNAKIRYFWGEGARASGTRRTVYAGYQLLPLRTFNNGP